MSLGVKGTQKRNKTNKSVVSKKISHLVKREGVPQEQAVAMAINMNKKGRLTKEGGYIPVKKKSSTVRSAS